MDCFVGIWDCAKIILSFTKKMIELSQKFSPEVKLNSCKKNIFVLIAGLFFVLFFGQAALAVAATFPDVPENTVHFGAVEYLKEKGVISGYKDGTFQPDKTINRAEALKMVMLAINEKLDSDYKLNFPDVSEKDWFFEFVRKASEIKIVEGYPDGSFKPENTINLAESLKVVLIAFNATLSTSLSNDPYPDVPKDIWYGKYADYGKLKELIWTLDDGKLHAERNINRGDFAELIYRFMYIKEKNLANFPLSTNWPTYKNTNDQYLVKYPFGWIKVEADTDTIFWKKDQANHQASFARVYPNGATAVITVDANEDRLSLDQYLARIEYDPSSIKQKANLNGYPFESVSIGSSGTNDFYLEFPNHSILIIYSQIGNGLNQPQLLNEIRYMVGSIRFDETIKKTEVSTKDQFLAEVRKNILVKGKGEDTLSMFKDLLLIETDAIGLGTGPVDYYYSSEYDVTLKSERDSKTILAMENGKKTSF